MPCAALATKPSAKPLQGSPEIAEKQADLGELRGRIEELRKALSTNEENKADAADRLRESERRVSSLQRDLQALSEQRAQLQRRLEQLEQQSSELGLTLAQQQKRLESLLHRQYLRGTPDALQLLLNGSDPNQMTRDMHYISSIAASRAELLVDIRKSLERKQGLAADAKARGDELAALEAERQKRHDELERERGQRQKLYAQLTDKVKAQRQEIGHLQQDEKRLSQLIDRLSKIIAAQAAQAARAAKAAEAARLAEAAKQAELAQQKSKLRPSVEDKSGREAPRPAPDPTRPRPAEKQAESENRHEPSANDGSFLRARGSLRLPVRGAVAGRFGSPRDGGGTWRGLFIRSPQGSEVKAVANGRVVFADWMRGFGNLLIVDHGDAYLSIYGNNDSLLKQVGQTVRGGDTLATVGNSGGNAESGLYFELRHQGQPIDPMKWASLK